MSRLFDTVVVVDWSSRGTPSPARESKDALWVGVAGAGERYFPTRGALIAWLAGFLAGERAAGRRVLAGFDFPFGYPAGFAAALTGRAEALAVWARLAELVRDDATNANNRFAAAAALNADLPGEGPFWGNGLAQEFGDLPRTRPVYGAGIAERRIAERAPYARGAKSCWQLSGAGSVGGQVLTGLPALYRLRRELGAAIWPFDTGLSAPEAPVVLAEVYPSLLAEVIRAELGDDILDRVQVRVTARALAALDAGGRLAALFEGAPGLTAAERERVAREEAWMLGAGHAAALREAAVPRDAAELRELVESRDAAPSREAAELPEPSASEVLEVRAGADVPEAAEAREVAEVRKAAEIREAAEVWDVAARREVAAGRRADDCFALPPGVAWVPVDAALAALAAGVAPVAGVETLPLAAAGGRVLATLVSARRANPPAANAAVDGYGYARASLGAPPHALPLVPGRAAAGAPFQGAVPAGRAVRVLTGALLPEGVDTVVLEEDTTRTGDVVRFERSPKAGANTRAAGEDVAEGASILPEGRRLGPQDLALAAAVGVAALPVRRRIRVAVLSTGDEIRPAGSPAAAHQTYDANRPMLIELLRRWGIEALDLGQAPDRAEAVAAALDAGAEADAILSSGGASAGDEDHVSALLRGRGEVIAWRIAVKPGRPLAIGLWRGRPIFALPGNPVAAFVCALVFARPALMRLAGEPWRLPRGLMLPAAFEKRKRAGRREYLRARLDDAGRVEVFASEGSGRISGLAWAEGLVELDDGPREVRLGDPVRYLPFAEFGL